MKLDDTLKNRLDMIVAGMILSPKSFSQISFEVMREVIVRLFELFGDPSVFMDNEQNELTVLAERYVLETYCCRHSSSRV